MPWRCINAKLVQWSQILVKEAPSELHRSGMSVTHPDERDRLVDGEVARDKEASVGLKKMLGRGMQAICSICQRVTGRRKF